MNGEANKHKEERRRKGEKMRRVGGEEAELQWLQATNAKFKIRGLNEDINSALTP